ncbi:MAG: protein translocase subunit SecD, partial [Actinobacteria bacterium]|nr:protein translocase subunit SecD [Actinomycetota bacterium]
AEPEISKQGSTIVVDLPGVKEQERARDLIGKTAELQFRPVLGEPAPAGAAEQLQDLLSSTTTAPASGETTTTAAPTSTTAPAGQGLGRPGLLGRAQEEDGETTTSAPAAEVTTTTSTAPAQEVEAGAEFPADQPIVASDRESELQYQLGPAEVTGRAVRTARAEFQGGAWAVNVEFTGQGSTEWDAMAAQYVGQRVAIVLDGVVQSAPTIQQAEFGGSAQITGDFSEGEAKDLALILRFGALPVELEQIFAEEVSATFGRDQLDAGIVAGIIGLILVAIYVFAYYRILGMVVWLSLVVTAGAIYAIVSWLSDAIGLTLTIAGVVGLIVSIGIAADSNIVYFERLKEEMRSGRTLRSAVDRGFKSAFHTIVAADTVTLLAAGLLWALAIGSVKGFAFYLGLATALDLAVSYFFMHPLVILIARNKRLSQSRWLGIAPPKPADEAAPA